MSTSYNFDDRNIRWFPFGGLDGFVIAMFDVDEKSNLVDFVIKFEPNSKIFAHQHLAHTNTFVVQGEHRLYEPDGKAVKEVRPTGTYTSSPPGDIHREGGGADGCIVYYSIRGGDDDRMFDVLDDDLKVTTTLRTEDFKNTLAEQRRA